MKRSIWILLLALVATVADVSAAKPRKRTSSGIKKEQHDNNRAIKQTSKQLEANAKNTERTLNALNSLNADIQTHERNIRSLEQQIDSADKHIAIVSDSITRLDNSLKQMRDSYAKALRHAETGQRASTSELAFIFSAGSFKQAYRRARYIKEFAAWRKRRSEQIVKTQDDLNKKREQLDKTRASRASKLSTLNKSRAELKQRQAETSEMVSELKRQGSSLKRVLKEQEEKARALDRELEKVIAEEQQRQEEEMRRQEELRKQEEEKRRLEEEARQKRLDEQKREQQASQADKDRTDKQQDDKNKEKKQKKAEKGKKPKTPKTDKKQKGSSQTAQAKPEEKPAEKPAVETSQPKSAENSKSPVSAHATAESTQKLTGTFESNKGRLLFPVTGKYKVVRPFGKHKHPDLPYVVTDNSGIDIEATPGSEARAIFDGKVSAIFQQPGYNTIVMIRHGKYLTIYANLTDIEVRNGQDLQQGQAIGKIYADPDDGNRSILHFEIRKEKEKLNPSLWVK